MEYQKLIRLQPRLIDVNGAGFSSTNKIKNPDSDSNSCRWFCSEKPRSTTPTLTSSDDSSSPAPAQAGSDELKNLFCIKFSSLDKEEYPDGTVRGRWLEKKPVRRIFSKPLHGLETL